MIEDKSTRILKTVLILLVIYSICFGIVLFSKGNLSQNIEAISESNVEEFIGKLNNAVKNKDAAYIVNSIAENADIEVQFGNHSICQDKDTYKKRLCGKFYSISSYNCDASIRDLVIENDTAHVKVNKHERIIFRNGKEMSGFKNETMKIALLDGQLKLTSYRVKSTMSPY